MHKHVCFKKAIDLGLKPCVVINKVDKENCTQKVHEKVFDLMFELGAEEWQLDFPTVYGSAKNNGCLIIGKT
jgi:GTP-binding protein